jgi:hypothetical protein
MTRATATAWSVTVCHGPNRLCALHPQKVPIAARLAAKFGPQIFISFFVQIDNGLANSMGI